MKPFILLVAAAALSFSASAQKTATKAQLNAHAVPALSAPAGSPYARITATGDTVLMKHVTSTDTPTLYFAAATSDSGFVSGTDAYGDMGYAERYDFGATDTGLNVVGVVALFGGKVNPASTKSVTFYTWPQGPQAGTPDPTVFNSGFPAAPLDSVSVPVTHLGIASVDTVSDTLKTFFFTTPSGILRQSFFVGYTINYDPANLGGDTIGLFTTRDGARLSPIFTVSGADTIVNNQNVTMYDDGTWHDNATDNFNQAFNFYIFPIAIIRDYTSVKGITRNNLTYFGAYPNPTATTTNIKIGLQTATDVTITFMNMSGQAVKTIYEPALASGAHIIPVNISDLPQGDYIYLVHTASGDGIAGKLSVIK